MKAILTVTLSALLLSATQVRSLNLPVSGILHNFLTFRDLRLSMTRDLMPFNTSSKAMPNLNYRLPMRIII